MRILALIGSPRKGSNTDILVDQILKGITNKRNSHRYEKLYLYDYEISPCIDCRYCKKSNHVCILIDGMRLIYPKMEQADLIIFGTPLYWYGPTGKMKLLVDRMRPYAANGKMKGKRWVIIASSLEGARACGPLVEMFRLSFDYLGMIFAGMVLAKAYENGEIRNSQKELERAYKFGASLVVCHNPS